MKEIEFRGKLEEYNYHDESFKIEINYSLNGEGEVIIDNESMKERDAEEFIMNLTERVKQAGVEDDLDGNNENE